MPVTATRADVLAFRVRAQQLDREAGPLEGTTVLDLGVQDSGPDGGLWALALRGIDVAALPPDALVAAWTIRGAPHLYRRADLPSVAAAVAPFSDADAAKRVYDAAKPLRAAGIPVLTALDTVADVMRSVVTAPMVKGEVSTRVTAVMDRPYLRDCRPCGATHLYEMPFRLAALRAGLELEAGTSPPVLRPVPGFARAEVAEERHDVVRGCLRLLGPATPKLVAAYLDAPVKDVQARWPQDAVQVVLEGEQRWVLADGVESLAAGPARTVRLLGPYDLFLQARDRALLVDDPARAKALWPVLGRPGAVLVDGEVAAPTAELLMRSRYSAFAVRDEDYLLATWHPSTRPADVALDPTTRWTGLEVLTTDGGGFLDTESSVEFRASYRGQAEAGEVHERSRFVRDGGRWSYLGAVAARR